MARGCDSWLPVRIVIITAGQHFMKALLSFIDLEAFVGLGAVQYMNVNKTEHS
jgi:hypothetical protein